MFRRRHGGDGSRHLPIAEKLAAGFELRNYLVTKRVAEFSSAAQPISIGILELIQWNCNLAQIVGTK
jgi:hypothetical protein